jgi:hypothetical protein
MGLVSKRNLLSVLCCLCLNLGVAIDTINSSRSLKHNEYIISNGSAFKLGFFSPVNSTNRYVGIWYNTISEQTVVWVANKQKPLKDFSGVLTISKEGNLVVLDERKEIIWSTSVTNLVVNSSAKLLDSGNLVLQENSTGTTKIKWESFQHPSNVFLPKMKIGADARTGQKVEFTSWKSPSDPSNGSFSCGMQVTYLPQVYIWKDGSPYWRSGPWNTRVFIGIPNMANEFLNGFSLQNDGEGTYYLSYSFVNEPLLHFFLNTDGNIELRYWNDSQWDVFWSSSQTKCDGYDKCGAFGSCNPQSSPICSCLRGFEPKNTEEWNQGNWSSGCVRRKPLQCGGESGKFDGFLKLNKMKVPDFEVSSYDLYTHEDECRQQCLQSCSCIAYAYDAGTGCLSWNRSLIDTQEFSSTGVDLYIRLAYSELGELAFNFKSSIRPP